MSAPDNVPPPRPAESGIMADVDALLKVMYGPDPAAIEKARKDPRVKEYVALGGTDALDGVKEMVECPSRVHAAKPTRTTSACSYCEFGAEGHDACWRVRRCSKCKDDLEVWTGRWEKPPTKDKRKRARLRALREEVGWEKIHLAEVGDPIGASLNSEIPLYEALRRAPRKNGKTTMATDVALHAVKQRRRRGA